MPILTERATRRTSAQVREHDQWLATHAPLQDLRRELAATCDTLRGMQATKRQLGQGKFDQYQRQRLQAEIADLRREVESLRLRILSYTNPADLRLQMRGGFDAECGF